MSVYEEQMKALDEEFQRRSGITDRSRYKIFYSHVHAFPLMVLGYNPGGDPEKPETLLDASTKYYKGWEHDMVAFRNNGDYRSALPVFELMASCVGSKAEDSVSCVPYSNAIFRRSKGKDDLERLWKSEGKRERDYVEETKPVLFKMLQIVAPAFLIVVKDTFRIFRSQYLEKGIEYVPSDPEVWADHRRRSCQILKLHTATLIPTGSQVHVAEIGHPSNDFARTSTWSDVCRLTANYFNEHGLADAISNWKRPS